MKFTKTHTLTDRRGQTIVVNLQGSVIKEVKKLKSVRFPFPIGSHWHMGISTWACNNNFTLDGQSPCPEEKIFGIKKGDIPKGHELRYLYPGKFAPGGKLSYAEYSNDALTDMVINLSRFENTEEYIQAVKDELKVRKFKKLTESGGFADKFNRLLKLATGGGLVGRYTEARNKAIGLVKGIGWKEEWTSGISSINSFKKKPIPEFIPVQADKQFEIIKNIERWYDVILEFEENKEAIVARKEQKDGQSRSDLRHGVSPTLMVAIDVYATGYNPNCTKEDRAKQKLRIEDGIEALAELISEDKDYFHQKMSEAIDSKLTEVEVLEEEKETLMNALPYLDGEDKKLIEEKLEIINQALSILGEPVKESKPAWESNVEALVHPVTGMAATIAKMDTGEKEKAAFLKRKGLTFDNYKKLDSAKKQEIGKEWVKSKEYLSMDIRNKFDPKKLSEVEWGFVMGTQDKKNNASTESFPGLSIQINLEKEKLVNHKWEKTIDYWVHISHDATQAYAPTGYEVHGFKTLESAKNAILEIVKSYRAGKVYEVLDSGRLTVADLKKLVINRPGEEERTDALAQKAYDGNIADIENEDLTLEGLQYKLSVLKEGHLLSGLKEIMLRDIANRTGKPAVHRLGKSENVTLNWEDLFAHPEKFMRYDGQFLYPPRIETRLQPSSLKKLDTSEYVGQPKLNGSNTSVTISETSVIAKERHNTFFAIPPNFDFLSLHRGNGFMAIAGEFMNKSKKDEAGNPFRGFCIWDIMAFNGKILIGSTIEERISLINHLYPSRDPISVDGIDYLYKTDTPGIYKVNDFYSNFLKIYDIITKVDMVEGFVMKRKNGKLEMMVREENNVGWAVKVRKPTANYHFDRGGTTTHIGSDVSMIRGPYKGKHGLVKSVDTIYEISVDGHQIKAQSGDFYNSDPY